MKQAETKVIVPEIAKRIERVLPFLAMDVLAAAALRERKGHSVIHMEVGQPSAPAPKPAREAAKAAIDLGRIGYTEALGIAPLRERIAKHYTEQYAVPVTAESIVTTTGSSAGFVLAFLAMFNPGDRVAITAPGYPAYRSILEALDIEPVFIKLNREDGWVLTAEALEKAHAEKPLQGVLIMSPANPSGTMVNGSGLSDIADFCKKNGVWLISDEIYHGLTYGVEPETALKYNENAVVINSFSKYYCMTGWRIGWIVVPKQLVRAVETLAQNLYISAPYLSQVAAMAAFNAKDDLEKIKLGYAANRSMLLEELPKIGISDMHPVNGAFYIYANVAHLTDDSLAFCRKVLNEAGVAITPGLDFDPFDGKHHIRLSFAGSAKDCREAVSRLGTWLK
ncbi:pyridoxal phosphate-dependent aminotransferase [Microvirga sp. W0021]|uniref:8-amino-7-oxononanoate synthase n=1 Tax=Hohaiivirga grylli TaxID=3133970 RepID=A0ABV0BJ30_9HYPH